MTSLCNSMSGYSPNIADFDNDGWKDIFVSRGDVQSPAMADRAQIDQPNTVFRNNGNGRWTALTEDAGFSTQPPRRHRGSAIGDFNHDGKLDVVVTALSAPAEIWMNDSPGANHWLELKLEGTKSNRDAIGARIRISVAGHAQYDHVSTASGYASSSAGPLHFGLGPANKVDEIEIRWPSGDYAGAQERSGGSEEVLKVSRSRDRAERSRLGLGALCRAFWLRRSTIWRSRSPSCLRFKR